MSRPLFAAIAVWALLSAVPAVAEVPPPPDITVQWFQPVASWPDPLVIGVCPLGDWSGLDVTMRNGYGLPMAGYQVFLYFADSRVCPATVSGITDMNGYVRLVLTSGLNSSAAATRATSSYTVTSMGYTVGSGTVSLVSPDYNCNPAVDALDFSFFSLDWPPAAYAARSDFNDDGVIDALDFSLFALHWLHAD